mmetsp:Transcript_12680/g.24051  ORF Transcript_12680/g.24051 Transcript_12680/m.24051 type:complete len:249 (+) Transcript_12680:214-960(+)
MLPYVDHGTSHPQMITHPSEAMCSFPVRWKSSRYALASSACSSLSNESPSGSMSVLPSCEIWLSCLRFDIGNSPWNVLNHSQMMACELVSTTMAERALPAWHASSGSEDRKSANNASSAPACTSLTETPALIAMLAMAPAAAHATIPGGSCSQPLSSPIWLGGWAELGPCKAITTRVCRTSLHASRLRTRAPSYTFATPIWESPEAAAKTSAARLRSSTAAHMRARGGASLALTTSITSSSAWPNLSL